MAVDMQVAEAAGRRYTALRAHLDERQRRLLLGVEAAELGRGGIKAIAAVTGVHPDTIGRGVGEMEGNPAAADPGAHRRGWTQEAGRDRPCPVERVESVGRARNSR